MAVKATNKATTNKKEGKAAVLNAKEISTSDKMPEEGQTEKVLSTEEAEELEEEQSAGTSESGGGNAAALAAVSGGTESASFKNFRHHPDMENFYRFIFENDLRHEALAIIDQIMVEKQVRKQVKASKAQPN